MILNVRKGFFGLIGLLLVMLIGSVIYMMLLRFHFGPVTVSEEDGQLPVGQRVNVSNYRSTLDKTKSILQDATKKDLERIQQIQDLK